MRHQNALAVKDVYCFPSTPAFGQRLGADRVPTAVRSTVGKATVLEAPMDNRRNGTGPEH